jgi:hypothetical protein
MPPPANSDRGAGAGALYPGVLFELSVLCGLTFGCRSFSWARPWTLLGALSDRGKLSKTSRSTERNSQSTVVESHTDTEGTETTSAPTSNLPPFPILSTSQPISPGRSADTPGDYEDACSPNAWLAGGPSSIPGVRSDSVSDELECLGAAALSGGEARATRWPWKKWKVTSTEETERTKAIRRGDSDAETTSSAGPLTSNPVIPPRTGCHESEASSLPRKPLPSQWISDQAGATCPETSSSTPRGCPSGLQRPNTPGGTAMLSGSDAGDMAGKSLLPVGYCSPSATMGDSLPGLQRSTAPGVTGVLSGSDARDTAWPLTDNQVTAAQARFIRRIQRRGVPSYGSIGQAISPEAVSTSSSSSATLTDSLPRMPRRPIPGNSYEDAVRAFAADSGVLSPVYESTEDDESSTPPPSTFGTIARSAVMVAAGLAVAGTALYFGGASTAFGGFHEEEPSTLGTLSRVGERMASGIVSGITSAITSGITSGMSAITSLTRNGGGDGWTGGGRGYNIASVWSSNCCFTSIQSWCQYTSLRIQVLRQQVQIL